MHRGLPGYASVRSKSNQPASVRNFGLKTDNAKYHRMGILLRKLTFTAI